VSRKAHIYWDKSGTRFWPVKTAFPLLSNSATPPSAQSPARRLPM
jgi:hypothetical protein